MSEAFVICTVLVIVWCLGVWCGYVIGRRDATLYPKD
jgi:hypothetical protein